jgi:nitroimidazol reductase NimA-like FMN-containing flavoprotein (pyridoxamine 5'-phosphate oxidase superfamily)
VALTDRTALSRLPERGSHERELVNAILDEGIIAQVGITTERGPLVLPMVYGRLGDALYLHGAPASRFVRRAKQGVPVCVTVTLVDALVLARSTFHHSINYRSVVVFAEAEEVAELDERAAALEAIVEHLVPGRTSEARAANEKEVRGTVVLRVPIDEASAKVRTGPPSDDHEDLELDVWAGLVPVTTTFGTPVGDGAGRDVAMAGSAASYRRPSGGVRAGREVGHAPR